MLARRIDGNVGLLPVQRLREEMDRLFEDFFGDWPTPAWDLWGVQTFPALNIWETDDALYAEAEVPGMKMEDLEVLVVGNELTIKGERKAPQQEGVTFHRQERGVGSFTRTIRLPVEIDADRVEATLENGVLTITLPKAEQCRPRKIEVKALTR